MKKCHVIFTLSAILFSSLFCPVLLAQNQAGVKNVEYSIQNGIMVINYDILNYDQDQRFNIVLSIETDAGQMINPVSVSGDIGKDIPGGVQKRIFWDFQKDQFAATGDFFVRVQAVSGNPAKITEVSRTTRNSENVGMAGALLRSAIIPGWGLSNLTGKSAYYFLGIAGYGLLATSVGMNRSASENYDNYLLEFKDPEKRQEYYDKAVSLDKWSKNVAIAAGVLWVGNLVWTGIVASDSGKNHAAGGKGFYPGASAVADNSIPLFGIQYRF